MDTALIDAVGDAAKEHSQRLAAVNTGPRGGGGEQQSFADAMAAKEEQQSAAAAAGGGATGATRTLPPRRNRGVPAQKHSPSEQDKRQRALYQRQRLEAEKVARRRRGGFGGGPSGEGIDASGYSSGSNPATPTPLPTTPPPDIPDTPSKYTDLRSTPSLPGSTGPSPAKRPEQGVARGQLADPDLVSPARFSLGGNGRNVGSPPPVRNVGSRPAVSPSNMTGVDGRNVGSPPVNRPPD